VEIYSMNYQGTTYSYNQRSEILIPTRRGTSYYGPQNHKPLIAYQGVTTDFEFYVTDTNRKPVSIENKTFTAKIIDRTTKVAVITRTLTPLDYAQGSLLMRLTEDNVASLSPALYDVTITYTDSESQTFGLYTDQNFRLTYVLEVKENIGTTINESITIDRLPGGISDKYPGTAQTRNSDGTNTAAVYLTNYTGKVFVDATLETDPAERDWFPIIINPDQDDKFWTFTNTTGIEAFTWDGMYMWVRFRFENDVANTGTLDKILYRA